MRILAVRGLEAAVFGVHDDAVVLRVLRDARGRQRSGVEQGRGEHLTIFYRGWHSHFEWYVNDLQWFEWMVGRFLAGDVAGLGLKDLDGNRIEN